MRLYLQIGLLLCWTISAADLDQTKFRDLPKALIAVPVADVVRKPFADLHDYPTVLDAYKALDYKETDEIDLYTRSYQVLFNEVVGIVEETEEEICIRIPYIFYQQGKGALPQSAYWVHKSAILPLDQLKNYEIDLDTLPHPIDLDEEIDHCNEGIVTLALPFYDAVTQQSYSVGTRFVRKAHNTELDIFSVYILNTTQMQIQTIEIPGHFCLITAQKTKEERIADFVLLVHTWANLPGIIPYVWGGSSFTHLCKDQEGCSVKPNSFPYTGFDCSCLIIRAAQICGIPFYLGNSQTIEALLEPLSSYEAVKDGDIIWFPGHVMIVGSKKDNTLIESRGYDAGWGRLFEAPLATIFKNVRTYEQLIQMTMAQQPIYLLHQDGSIRSTLTNVKLFSLGAAWGEKGKLT